MSETASVASTATVTVSPDVLRTRHAVKKRGTQALVLCARPIEGLCVPRQQLLA